MPCYATGSALGDAELHASEAREQVTKLTRLLCEACETLTQVEHKAICSTELREWWKEHQRIDAERKAEQARRLARRKLSRQALSKLTPKERNALGFK